MHTETPILSICTTCRDGRETAGNLRGGTRLGQKVLHRIGDQTATRLQLRGVRCMSQCKRPCIASLSAHGKFTYVFGDLDPERLDHIDALLELVTSYSTTAEGFLERAERPKQLRSNILGRLPPIDSISPVIIQFDEASVV